MSPGKAIENLFVSLGQRSQGLHELRIVLDLLDLGFECFEHERVDADAPTASNDVCLLGKLLRNPYRRGSLRHAIMLPRLKVLYIPAVRSPVTMTMDHYTHLFPSDVDTLIRQLDDSMTSGFAC